MTFVIAASVELLATNKNVVKKKSDWRLLGTLLLETYKPPKVEVGKFNQEAAERAYIITGL